MTDKIVTHKDLGDLLDLRSHCADFDSDEAERKVEMLDRLIAAAEADAPPLPEGWVLYRHDDGGRRVLWHEAGQLYTCDDPDDAGAWDHVAPCRDRLTPLRPTITGDDLDRAVDAYFDADDGDLTPRGTIRAAFAAAGVVIEP